MNGPEHYREAERLLHEVNRQQSPNFEGTVHPVHHDALRTEMVARAQVHATLAHAAATAATHATLYDGDERHERTRGWAGVV